MDKAYNKIKELEKISLFGVGITNEEEKNILEYIITSLEKTDNKYYIVTPNPEILVYADKHESFKNILNNAKIALIDGMGIVWASKILGKGVKQRITGADFIEKVCNAVAASNATDARKPITVGFLGAGPEISERTAECLMKKYPGLKVVFAAQEPDKLPKSLKEPKLLIDILFVAFGFPKQEIWMSENLGKLPFRVAIGVGGAFDYISGSVPRSPVFLRKLGFEWLYRLIHQPWRWKRQLALVEFIYMVMKERIKPGML